MQKVNSKIFIMGKPTGFLEYNRVYPEKRPVQERKKDYNEFVQYYPKEELNRQSARCMNCGIPFCHSGCPLGNVIPEFNDAVYRGNWKEAYDILTSTNNFPEFTGRICPAPCESACVLGISQPPVAIEEIERHIIEIAFENGYVQPVVPNVRTGKKVAVIGSGPSGLAAASQLNSAGHSVTVYEKSEAPGGLLRFGIPDFKLEKWVVERRIGLMQQSGINFICNANIGETHSVNDLLRNYHALVLCGGSSVPRNLNIPGREGPGVHFAMDYLTQQNKINSSFGIGSEERIDAYGKNVIVIGGGDTGSDCVGTANRQGALTVTQFELLPQPPVSRNENMPWPLYPMVLKTTSSHEEGCERYWSVSSKEFIRNEEGNLQALKITEIEWGFNEEGKPANFHEIPGTERILPCDLVLLAMGFVHPQYKGMINDLSLELDEKGNVRAPENSFLTSTPRVFAAGDMRRGQSLVVWAIQEGRECARKVDEWLMGTTLLPTNG